MAAAKEVKSGKEAKDAKAAKPKFLVNAKLRYDFDPDRLLVQEADKSPTMEIMSYYPVVYQIAKGSQVPPVLRTPFLHTGFGAGRPEFKKDGVVKKGAERLTLNFTGKPTTPEGTANPVHEFHDLIQDLDKWTVDWARNDKMLGDEVDDNAYDRCYVPLCRVPGGSFPDQITAKLPSSYGRPQWFLWDITAEGKPKEMNREKLGYDTLVAADITLPSIWVNYGSGTKGAQYGWTTECNHVYKPATSYDEGFTSRKEVPTESPW